MKKNRILIFCLLTLSVFTIVIYNKLKEQKDINESIKFGQKDFSKDDELNCYKVNFKANILNNNLQLKEPLVKDSLGNTISLREVFDSDQKQIMVCRFSQTHCESCIISSIQTLAKKDNLIGLKNVVFLGNYKNNRIFYKTLDNYGIQYMKVFNTSVFNIPAEEVNYPYYFVLNNNLRIANVFFPNKGLAHITNEYLENIQKKF